MSATIEYGDFELRYSLKDGKFSDTSFNRINNWLCVANDSTCPITVDLDFTLKDEFDAALGECGFQLTFDEAGESTIEDVVELSYCEYDENGNSYGPAFNAYLTATKTETLEAIHGYNLNNAEIGSITVTLESNLMQANPL